MEHPIGQSSFSAFAYDVQYSFGISRHEYLPVIFRRNHLSSFAMCRAFPGSDYYEDSVTIGVSPRRPSRVPFDFWDGVLLVSTYIYQRSTAIKTATRSSSSACGTSPALWHR